MKLCQWYPWNAWAGEGVLRAILDQQGAHGVAIKSIRKDVEVRVSRIVSISVLTTSIPTHMLGS